MSTVDATAAITANAPANAPATVDVPPHPAAPSDLHRVAAEFEALMLRQLLHTAHVAGNAGPYGDMAVDSLASGISQAGGIGLTAQIEAMLSQGHAAGEATPSTILHSSSEQTGRTGI